MLALFSLFQDKACTMIQGIHGTNAYMRLHVHVRVFACRITIDALLGAQPRWSMGADYETYYGLFF